MKLIPYYEDSDKVPLPEIKEIKEIKYEGLSIKEYNIYFKEMFAIKDIIIIGVNYISYYIDADFIERFSFLLPNKIADSTWYVVPARIRKLVRDYIKR